MDRGQRIAGGQPISHRGQCRRRNLGGDQRLARFARPDLSPIPPCSHATLAGFGLRDGPIGAELLTNGDVDHVAGLLSLRESQAFDLFANATIHQVLRENPIFLALNPAFVAHKIAGLDQYFTLLPGFSRCQARCRFTLRGAGSAVTDALVEETVGVELSAGGLPFIMCRVAPTIPDDLAERLCGAVVIIPPSRSLRRLDPSAPLPALMGEPPAHPVNTVVQAQPFNHTTQNVLPAAIFARPV